MRKTAGIDVTHVSIKWDRHKIPCIILNPKEQNGGLPGVLWLHGGGYLRGRAKTDVSPYASPERQTDYRDLPPAYTFVGTGEPFFEETKTYIEI